jgi:hypothetical protein
MDAKDVKNRGLTIPEYIHIVNMLQASEEDFEVATSNIKNLMDESPEWDILLKLMYKELVFSKRYAFSKELLNLDVGSKLINYNDPLSYATIYKKIKDLEKASVGLKALFTYVISNLISKTNKTAYDFIDDVNIKIKW